MARILRQKEFHSKIVKSKKPKLIAEYLDNKMKYDIQ